MLSLGKALQRAGAHVAPDQKPATAAEGLAFRARFNSVGADYFATVGLPILRGRAFSAGEATQSEGSAVAVIDETLAKNLWPDGDALGQHLQYAEDNAPRAKGDGGDNMGISQGGKGNIKTGEADRSDRDRAVDTRCTFRAPTTRVDLCAIRARLSNRSVLFCAMPFT